MTDPIASQNAINAMIRNALPQDITEQFEQVANCYETAQRDRDECRDQLRKANADIDRLFKFY